MGHLISDKGIYPLPEKLTQCATCLNQKNAKEIKQFLGLCGYYRKFVPHFADILRPLAKLTGHEVKWNWHTKCDLSFQLLMIQIVIIGHPINWINRINHINQVTEA